MIGVYGIYNLTKDKWYIGSSVKVEERINSHLKSIEQNILGNYTIDNNDEFKTVLFKILDTKAGMQAYENYYIAKYNSLYNGYNKSMAYRPVKIFLHVDQKVIKSSNVKFAGVDEICNFLKISKDDFEKIKDELPHTTFRGINFYHKKEVFNYIMGQIDFDKHTVDGKYIFNIYRRTVREY